MEIEVDEIFRALALSAPYLQLIEEFTLEEIIHFHFTLKNPVGQVSLSAIPGLLKLEEHMQKHIRNFSSGMKQRLNVGLAIFSDAMNPPATSTKMELPGLQNCWVNIWQTVW